MTDDLREKKDDYRWYCPFYKSLRRTEDRWYICCEGGSRMSFERTAAFEAFADRFCRCGDYRNCTVARSRFEHWGVDPDER